MDPRVRRAISLMRANLHRDLDLNELALSMNLSASRLRLIFKAETGMIPKHYLKVHRLQKAKGLLESSFLKVKVIVLKVGIRDHSHFRDDFKRAFGAPPFQYREHYRTLTEKELPLRG